MDQDQIHRLARQLTGGELEHLRRLQLHGTQDVSEFGSDQDILKSLEVHDLVFRRGSVVSLTHRGKLVARCV